MKPSRGITFKPAGGGREHAKGWLVGLMPGGVEQDAPRVTAYERQEHVESEKAAALTPSRRRVAGVPVARRLLDRAPSESRRQAPRRPACRGLGDKAVVAPRQPGASRGVAAPLAA